MRNLIAFALLALALAGGTAALTALQTRPAVADGGGCTGGNC